MTTYSQRNVRREPKYAELRHSKWHPQKSRVLSGVLELNLTCSDLAYCNVRFSKKLETLVGKMMPYGISPEFPARLILIEFPDGYRLYARYVRDKVSRFLWKYDELPAWAADAVEDFENGNQKTKKTGSATCGGTAENRTAEGAG